MDYLIGLDLFGGIHIAMTSYPLPYGVCNGKDFFLRTHSVGVGTVDLTFSEFEHVYITLQGDDGIDDWVLEAVIKNIFENKNVI